MNFLKPNFLMCSIFVLLIVIIFVPILPGFLFHMGAGSSIFIRILQIAAIAIAVGPSYGLSYLGLNVVHGDFIPSPTLLGFILTVIFYYIIIALISLLVKEENRRKVGKIILRVSVIYTLVYFIIAYFLPYIIH